MKNMKIFSSTKVTIVSFLLLFLTAADAQNEQDLPFYGLDDQLSERGISGTSAYQFSDFGTVNLRSGSLNLSIPIGQQYQVSDRLSYGLSLNYSSAVWDNYEHCTTENSHGPKVTYFEPYPNKLSNAGLGWSIGMGRLLEPGQFDDPSALSPFNWVYVNPDGGRHKFNGDELHPGAGVQPGVRYTLDGSYLRLSSKSAAECHNPPASLPGSQQCFIVEFPDGQYHEFHDLGQGRTPGDANWRLTSIREPYDSHYVNIDYTADEWIIEDSVITSGSSHRQHRVKFESNHPPYSYMQVREVHLEKFNGGTKAQYQFTYFDPATTLDVNEFFSVNLDNVCNLSASPPPWPYRNVNGPEVTFLKSILLPGDTSEEYRFSYYQDTHIDPQNPQVRANLGAIKDARVPTGAKFEWDYGGFYTRGKLKHRRMIGLGFGVTERRRYANENDSLATETWLYETSSSSYETPADAVVIPGQSGAFIPCFYMTTVVRSPSGYKDKHYFQGAQRGFDRRQGLPFTYCDPYLVDDVNYSVPGDPEAEHLGPFLSKEELDENDQLLRAYFTEYRSDAGAFRGHEDYNQRVIVNKTEYHDDCGAGQPTVGERCANPRWVKTVSSDNDGYGHYRANETTVSPNWPGSDDAKTSYIHFNPTAGSLPDNSHTSVGFNMLAANQPWILETFAETIVSQAGSSQIAQYCHDSDTGVLKGIRTLAGGSPALNDLLTLINRDEKGEVSSWQLFGGDQATVPEEHICQTDAVIQYEAHAEYQSGVLSKAYYVDCNAVSGDDDIVLQIARRDIDPYTGLVKKSYDSSDVPTVFEFDELSRLTAVKPQDLAWVHTEYSFPASGSSDKPQLKVLTCASGVDHNTHFNGCESGQTLGESITTMDGFGQTTKEQNLVPGIGLAERTIEYDANGRVIKEGLWAGPGQAGSVGLTEFTDYDRFNRVGKATLPDRISEVINSYKGNRVSTSKVKYLAHHGVEQQTATKHQYNDGFGRLVRVAENSDRTPGSGFEFTTYAYDQNDRLTAVCVNDPSEADYNPFICDDGQHRHGQQRLFNYDGRGLITSVIEPELGNKMVRLEYDAIGNVVKRDAPGTAFDTITYYDPAGRVSQVVDGSFTLLKDFFYARSNQGNNLTKGKLTRARRHNYIKTHDSPSTLDHLTVAERFEYAQKGGLLSSYSIRAGEQAAFESEISSYNDLGLVEQLQYPQCTEPFCSNHINNRTVNYTYSQGLLISVPGFVNSVLYHANGSFNVFHHSNGVSDIQQLDAYQWRLAEITAQFNNKNIWQFGPINYDQAGNIISVGGHNGEDKFTYDAVGRLTRGEVQTSAGSAVQTISYDAYGNITAMNSQYGGINSGPGVIAIDQSTNQLSNAAYDAAGNVTDITLGSENYHFNYDAFNRATDMNASNGENRSYLYSASGERVATLDLTDGSTQWTPRSATNQVLRRFHQNNSELTLAKEYIYAGSRLIAAALDGGDMHHFHLDQLGTSRRVTDDDGAIIEANNLFPFGGYTDIPDQNAEELLFTGHERDKNGNSNHLSGDLDYMHARYYSPFFGRFLSVDPISGEVSAPQSWNRFTYVRNNPITLTDPDGRSPFCDSTCQSFRNAGFGDIKNRPLELLQKQANITARGLKAVKITLQTILFVDFLGAKASVGFSKHVATKINNFTASSSKRLLNVFNKALGSKKAAGELAKLVKAGLFATSFALPGSKFIKGSKNLVGKASKEISGFTQSFNPFQIEIDRRAKEAKEKLKKEKNEEKEDEETE